MLNALIRSLFGLNEVKGSLCRRSRRLFDSIDMFQMLVPSINNSVDSGPSREGPEVKSHAILCKYLIS